MCLVTSRPSTSTGVPCVPTTCSPICARPPSVVLDAPDRRRLVQLDERLGELDRAASCSRLRGRPRPIETRPSTERVARAAGERRPHLRGTPGRVEARPWPSTRRISWYSHGDSCSSMSSWRGDERVEQSPRGAAAGAAVASSPLLELAGRRLDLGAASLSQSSETGARSGRAARRGGSTPRASSGARAARRCAGSARSRSRRWPGRMAAEKSSCRHGRSILPGMSDLFADAARAAGRRVTRRSRTRMRPRTLDEFVGQDARRSAEGSRCAARSRRTASRSPILYGPPGRGQDDARADRRRRDRRGVRGAVRRLGDGRAGARGDRARPRAARRAAAGARSSSSTRSTASTRRSRTRSCRTSRTGTITLIGATTENPYFEVNSALLSRSQVYELEPLTRRASSAPVVAPRRRRARRRRCADERRRRDRASGPAATRAARSTSSSSRRRRAPPERAGRAAPRRGRGAQAAAPLRQGRRRALRLHLRLHQVDARLRPGRGGLLPRGDAGGAARTRASSRGGW